MRYMLLLGVPSATPDDADAGPPAGAWEAYTDELGAAGVLVAGDGLEGAQTATTVREREGVRIVTDGPYADTKELLGGYYVIDVADLDAALAWAAKVPNAPYGSVEVRPVMVFDAP